LRPLAGLWERGGCGSSRSAIQAVAQLRAFAKPTCGGDASGVQRTDTLREDWAAAASGRVGMNELESERRKEGTHAGACGPQRGCGAPDPAQL
jgi:hypothetical protein